MLADLQRKGWAGRPRKTLHHKGAWLDAVVDFLLDHLPEWRDETDRPSVRSETNFTSQLCKYLNEVRVETQFDCLQFNTEEPDAGVDQRRRLDLAISPCNAIIFIDDRRYDKYSFLVPIECKRLPIPDRDEREYLHTAAGTTGGIQRFKHGYHGSASALGVMIAYIDKGAIPGWVSQISQWVDELIEEQIPLWSTKDHLSLDYHDRVRRSASLTSANCRAAPKDPIRLRHLWIEMYTDAVASK